MTPISSKDWALIEADIMLADAAMANKDNLQMVAMAGYHYTQAIEKSLKALIRANDTKAPEYNHDISLLLVQTEICCPNFILNHKFIADNARMLSLINTIRYGNKVIKKSDVYVLMKEAQRLCKELEQALLDKEMTDRSGLLKQANTMYKDSGEFISLDDRNSEYKSYSRRELYQD